MSDPWPPLSAARTFPLWALLATSCASKDASVTPDVRSAVPMPVRGTTLSCGDVRNAYVCWDDQKKPVSATPPELPGVMLSPLGYRCHGVGRERVCRDRAFDATPFECRGDRCEQRHVRFPDDGEWECADSAGATLCRGGAPPSGVAPGARSEGFWCGTRRVADAETNDRVCVDLSPDFPPVGPRPWVCHFEATRRVCEPNGSAHLIGDSCDTAHPCVDGTTCVAGRCAPSGPAPSCWLDRDCASGSCRFGSCAGGGT